VKSTVPFLGAEVVYQSRSGAGLREGFSHAMGRIAVTLDGDYDPADALRVIEPILRPVI
jgi:hypothetical protein